MCCENQQGRGTFVPGIFISSQLLVTVIAWGENLKVTLGNAIRYLLSSRS